MPPTIINDCFLHDKQRLRHDEAIEILRSRLVPIAACATVELGNAHGKILAENVYSPRNIPAFDNSAVDGFAFAHNHEHMIRGLQVDFRIAAGDTTVPDLAAGHAARIFTGAPMPKNADTVAMQEDCKTKMVGDVSYVFPPKELQQGANVRMAGEDVKIAEAIANKGCHLRPQDIAAIASAGFANIEAYKPLKIALFSTGEEIVRPGNKLETGQVYDANHFMICSLLSTLPVEVTDLGILPDNRQQVETALNAATKIHDIVITTGGASLGDEDHVSNILDQNGKRHMWQLAIKPGRPVCFGQLNDTYFFGLPGNPVAGFICFLLYVRPSILRLAGAHWHEPQRYKIPSAITFNNKKRDRREFWRGYIEQHKKGAMCLKKFERDGSGLISGLQKADGLIEISEDTTDIMPGDMLDFIPFTEFGIT